ncbi:hypothetical protein GGI20_004586 [Coemansia sp. BCRC 34301]|nr:hypothetical protein GGI20_004586 [Coemansia sp. BCRC 34301]
MATQQQQQQSRYNYDYSGVSELKNGARDDAVSIASGSNTATQHDDGEHGDRQRNNPMHTSDFPPYPPPQQQQQNSSYMNPQQQRPYMRPPPPYASNTWQPPPHHQQQQQQPDYLTGDSHAGPMRPHFGSEVSDYETYAAATQHRPNGPPAPHPGVRPPPPQQHHNQRPPPMRPNMRPPPNSHYNSSYHSDSDSSSSANGHKKSDLPKFSFLNCLKESFQHIKITDVLPLATVLGATAYHHYTHRNRGYVVPFKEPQWVRYVGNAVFTHNAISHMRPHMRPNHHSSQYGGNNKNSGGIPWNALLGTVAGAFMGRPGFGGGGGSSNYGGGGYGRPNGGYPPYGRPNGYGGSGFNGGGHGFGSGPNHGSGDMVSNVLGKIMGSLFGGGGGGNKQRPGMGTRDLNGEGSVYDDNESGLMGGFDSSAAVQKTVAEYHYRHIYRKQLNLRHATAQALGGAAAIKVLRNESHVSRQLYDSGIKLPADLTHDQIMMGSMLAEVSDLLERKAEVAQLEHDETLENVGKIALATIIKIKMDEDEQPPFPEKQPYTAYSDEPPPRSYSDYDASQSYQHTQSRRHRGTSSAGPASSSQPRRNRHRRSESFGGSDYAVNEKDSHGYVH